MSRTQQDISQGETFLGIELGSTRIKVCLLGSDPSLVLASGSHEWQNELEGGFWTYSLESIWRGIQGAYRDLVNEVENRYGVRPKRYQGFGVSAMMHGYLALDNNGELLVPFRTWRNTNTGPAAAELSDLFDLNIPLRWSIAHLHQAVLNQEPHVPHIRSVTTLAGYVHQQLTGRKVLGVGDASGMFPIDSSTNNYDAELLERYNRAVSATGFGLGQIDQLLPEILVAGQAAGYLTPEGASRLDPTGELQPGAVACPPEGDAGTGMVATCSVAPRTGNVSVGTSIFAMVVLEQPLKLVHPELDLVTSPAGHPVAMVHCNNGASELAAWAGLFSSFSAASGAATGTPVGSDAVFDTLFQEALKGAPDAGGLLAYNHLAGEPITGNTEGRPIFVRTPASDFTLANFMRAQIYGVFATLSLGMSVLTEEGVRPDRMFAHGGLFRTAGVAQRFLSGALATPISVAESASEGGAWGIAVLASYVSAVSAGSQLALDAYLRGEVFDRVAYSTIEPLSSDVEGFAEFLTRYKSGLALQGAAVRAL